MALQASALATCVTVNRSLHLVVRRKLHHWRTVVLKQPNTVGNSRSISVFGAISGYRQTVVKESGRNRWFSSFANVSRGKHILYDETAKVLTSS